MYQGARGRIGTGVPELVGHLKDPVPKLRRELVRARERIRDGHSADADIIGDRLQRYALYSLGSLGHQCAAYGRKPSAKAQRRGPLRRARRVGVTAPFASTSTAECGESLHAARCACCDTIIAIAIESISITLPAVVSYTGTVGAFSVPVK